MKTAYMGLNPEEVAASRREHGANILTPPKRVPVWKLFLEKFGDPVIRVLLIAALLSLCISFVEGEYAETTGIFCAIFLATGVAFWFEYDAQKKFDLLGGIDNEAPYKVVRSGEVHEIPKKDIVVGDIILLETGEEVPADGKLLESLSLSINESNLTGEPSIAKSVDPRFFNNDATYPSDMVMRGTTVLEGNCTMKTTAVGDSTEYGKVARQAAITTDEKTPLGIQLDSLAKFIGVAGFSLAFLIFAILFAKDISVSIDTYTGSQLWLLGAVLVSGAVMLVKVWMPVVYDAFELMRLRRRIPKAVSEGSWTGWIAAGAGIFIMLCGLDFLLFGTNPLDSASWIPMSEAGDILQYFMVAVTLIVVAVPEGLPMSVTLSLALSMRRMLRSNNLVRKMHACETMGAATVICTDKTGTLTRNQMTVRETVFYGAPELVKEGIAINSTAFLERDDDGTLKPIGNPTEGALLLWLQSEGVDFMRLREEAVVVDRMPFSTERKFMGTLVQKGNVNILYLKGAPEVILSKCSLSAKAAADIKQSLYGFQSRAMRTLAFAYAETDAVTCKDALAHGKIVLLAIAAIADPVRDDVPAAVGRCLHAGINVKMVTGDTSATAIEIGRQTGIWDDDDDGGSHMTGAEFEALSDGELLGRVEKLKIMSRARPMDKQRLVQLLQRRGEVVAVTGDGTNDAPALNFAQVGLSMGSGTYVAKEASDITLLDDSFGSIATAVMWGRSLYRNIQRFAVFQLTINFTALVIVFLGSIFGTHMPLTVTQMLWVNLIMDTFAAGALASLPPDPKVMNDLPRDSSAFIITRSMTRSILGVGMLFVVVLVAMLVWFGHEITPYRLSVFFTVFVMLQFWNMFNVRAFATGKSAFSGLSRCTGFLAVLLVILAGQVLIVTYGGEVFRTVPLSLADWLKITAATSVVLWAGEIFRKLKR